MTKQSSPFPPGIAAVLAASLMLSVGLTGAALAAGPPSSPLSAGDAPVAGQAIWYRFGPAATVVEREGISADNVTLVTLSNGVRLVLKQTDLVDDEMLVNVIVDGGLQSLAPGNLAAAEIAESLFLSGGVGLKTHEQLVAMFGPAASSIEFNVWTPWFNLGGKGQSDDLRSLLEILTAYVGDPGWRFDGLDAAIAESLENAELLRSNPVIALKVQAPGLLTSGDPRYVRPSAAQFHAVDADDARRAIESQFRSGVIEIAIVGDFEPEAAISMAAATFGTLPPRAGVAPVRTAPLFPPHTTTPMEVTFNGDPGQQGRLIAWPAPLAPLEAEEEQAISALLGAMVYRLMDLPAYETVHFAKGLKAQNGYLAISAFGRPENLGAFDADVARIARDIVAHGVTQEEIDRAQAPAVADVRAVEANALNQYWLVTAMNLRGDRANWERARSLLAHIEGVSPQEVQSAAARYLIEDRSVAIIAVPEPAPVD